MNPTKIPPIESDEFRSLVDKVSLREDQIALFNALESFKNPSTGFSIAKMLWYLGYDNAQRNSTIIRNKYGSSFEYQKIGYFEGDDSYLRKLVLGRNRIGLFKMVGKENKKEINALLLVCADLNEQANLSLIHI